MSFGRLKLAMCVISICINALPNNGISKSMLDVLKLPNTGDIPSIMRDVVVRADEYDKTVHEYIKDGGNIPLFIPKDEQAYAGRFYIPDVGVDVALYESTKQSVCDKKDSACFFNYGAQRVVADHWNQGFGAIKKCVPGTTAYIFDGEKTERFICTDIIDGHNYKGVGLTTWDGEDIWTWNKDGITCYTCNGCSENIKIVFFKKA